MFSKTIVTTLAVLLIIVVAPSIAYAIGEEDEIPGSSMWVQSPTDTGFCGVGLLCAEYISGATVGGSQFACCIAQEDLYSSKFDVCVRPLDMKGGDNRDIPPE